LIWDDDWENESQELTESLLHTPAYLPARMALARNYVATNEPKSALALMDAAPEAQKKRLEVLIERNWALLSLGSKEAARSGIEQALSLARNSDVLEQDGIPQDDG
jgi:Flp pilus assembly protein TadD